MQSDIKDRDQGKETVRCIICEKHAEKQKTFTCRKCRKTPFCLEHLDAEFKLCSGCAAEKRMGLYNNLIRQEGSIKAFLRLIQFIFVVVAVFFVVKQLFYEHVPEFMKVNIFFENLFIWGGVAAGGMVFCYVLLYSQRRKIGEIEEKIQSHKVYSRYVFR